MISSSSQTLGMLFGSRDRAIMLSPPLHSRHRPYKLAPVNCQRHRQRPSRRSSGISWCALPVAHMLMALSRRRRRRRVVPQPLLHSAVLSFQQFVASASLPLTNSRWFFSIFLDLFVICGNFRKVSSEVLMLWPGQRCGTARPHHTTAQHSIAGLMHFNFSFVAIRKIVYNEVLRSPLNSVYLIVASGHWIYAATGN